MFNVDDFKMGYIIAYKSTGSLFNRLITKRQLQAGFSEEEAQYVHLEVSGGGRHSVNISPPISKMIDITKVHKGRGACLLRYKNDDYEARGRYKVAYFSAALCANRPYDVSGVLSFLFKWITHNNRLYFCSEGVMAALKMEYPRVMPIPAHKVMPAHFIASKQFEKVWEGVLL